ncbi:MAG: N-6 DNA methylase [Bacteroidales bacterium]|nr:N-6 DNA methylase [Bacteroidales bacterium]
MQTKEDALQKIKSLVERFDEQKESYKKAVYNETQTRRDFIDPFWKALGWDVDNENGYAESYREVIHEDRVKVGKATKSPDYSFRLPGGKRLFFLEAKKPSVEIKNDSQPAYQIRRYGWSAKLPISVITDFEEFAIYDCTNKPKETDKASTARIKYLTYDNYIKEFDFIWDTFSKERVLKGSFDKYIQSDKNKKGTTTVDHDFLQSLDKWRIELAKNIALRNKNITEDELNYVVQLTIDRIVFLRIAEDRGAEQYGELQTAIANIKGVCPLGGEYYQNLLQRFRIADQKYNSGLFDFERGKISTEITIDNKVIKSIVSEFYYPVCPYEFSVLSVEILGSAYEQFLGKSISLSKGGRAIIEEKPEVRKAGGVYYTPQYIVDYIVKNTVGKTSPNPSEGGEAPPSPPEGGGFGGLTPDDVAKIKICDPACGSGSFLIGAYQYLLSWHKDYYTKLRVTSYELQEEGRKQKAGRGIRGEVLTPTGELTTAEKKRILLNNIYGVDLDSNAVEVTKLSLLLKCMEGETQESIEAQTKLFHEPVLPALYNNIKSGNSLIDLDYYDSQLDFGEERKIKPFSWEKAFPEVFAQGGFDCVIGNPPYGAALSKDVDTYLRKTYRVANYQLDTYTLFIERAKNLLIKNGFLGFIIPSAWVASTYDIKVRKYLAEESRIENFVITPKQTFKDASVETCILVVSNQKPSETFEVERWDTKEATKYGLNTNGINEENSFVFPVYADEKTNKIIQKIRMQKTILNDFADVVWGVKIYENGKGKPPQNGNESKAKTFHSDKKVSATHRPLLGGSEIVRYALKWKGGYVNYGEWLAAPRQPHWFEGERILVREVTANGIIQATLVEDDFVFSNSVDGIKMKSKEIDVKYLLALINSKLVSFYHSNTSANAFKGAFPKVLLHDLRELPIPNADIKTQNEIVKNVDLLLQLNTELQAATLPEKKEQIQARIGYCEDRINGVVYGLYGLGEEEVKIIEK